jgi:ABC-type Fe3+ transport system substrate-binding protein
MCKRPFGVVSVLILTLAYPASIFAADAKRPPEWNKVLEAAKKDGKIVIAIPPAAELRKEMEIVIKQKLGLEAELLPNPGPRNASRIAAEQKAGVRFFDALIVGTGTALGLAHDGMLEALEPSFVLPEVKDPKQWWGGHIWEDNLSTNRFLYSFLADVSTHGVWYNTTLAKPEDFRSFDDYLNPKWKGKIGFSDPRVPSSGQSIWSFMWDLKGEEFLKRLVQQDLFITRDLRQLTDSLAKGKVAVAFGIGRSQADPFVTAGLPLKTVPPPKEGLPASNSFGVIGVVKNAPHANATKVFINWFLSRDGQEWYGKLMENGTRRLDVDTKWLNALGVSAAKDALTIQDYHRMRNHLEDKYTKVRVPAGKFAETIIK